MRYLAWKARFPQVEIVVNFHAPAACSFPLLVFFSIFTGLAVVVTLPPMPSRVLADNIALTEYECGMILNEWYTNTLGVIYWATMVSEDLLIYSSQTLEYLLELRGKH